MRVKKMIFCSKTKKYNKGFTLVEVLSIIAVLGIITVLVFPKFSGSNEVKKEREFEKIKTIIENAGKFYHSFNSDEYKISVEKLKEENYITSELKNPETGEDIDGCVRITKDSDGFLVYKYTSCDAIEVPFHVELNGGTGQKFESTYYDSTIIELIDPTKENSDFKGWEVVQGNSILDGKRLIIGDTETTLWAKWESWPTLNVEYNGGKSDQTFKSSYKSGTSITLEPLTKEGYRFTGWKIKSGNGILSGNTFTMGSENTTIEATFVPLVIQAIYSETDNSLMYINDRQYSVGETYNGKVVTAVYTGFESKEYDETAIPWYSYRGSIKKVDFIDEVKPTSLKNWFRGFSVCIEMNLKKLNTSNATSLYHTFEGMSSLTSLDVSHFDTSKVTTMSTVFKDCSKLTTLDLSKWNTSNVTAMNVMFGGMTNLSNLNISNFNTSKVTKMDAMFQNCNSLTTLDLSSFDTSKVIQMHAMFSDCSSLTSLDLSNFYTPSLTTATQIFMNCNNLKSLDISNFNTSKVTNLGELFKGCSSLTSLDLSNFNTSSATIMYWMFQGCRSLTELNLSNFNTANVDSMSGMFYNCNNLTNLDLSSFDTSKVTTMTSMFRGNTKLRVIYVSDKWTTSAVTTSTEMFLGCSSLVGGLGTTYNSSYIDKTYARVDKSGTPGYFTYKASS